MKENSRKDIQEVDKLIKKCDECKLNECINCEISWTEVVSIKKITDEYKKILKMNEVLLKENKELKNIELKSKGGAVKISLDGVLSLENKIKQLEKENEELKRLMAHKNGYTKLLEEDLFENCSNYVIPIQTIKGKIEELKQEKEKYGNCLIKMYEDELVNRDIKILQELLEGRKENDKSNR